MSKIVDTAKVAACAFSAIKFLATETKKESKALEISCYDSKGVFMFSATAPMHAKQILVDAGTDEKRVTDGTVRVPFKGLWQVKGLTIVEGDRNPLAFRLYGDYEITGPSTVVLLTRAGVVEGYDPF
jgi:hypothetical protein